MYIYIYIYTYHIYIYICSDRDNGMRASSDSALTL